MDELPAAIREDLEEEHLPLLEAEGLIEWDREADTVRQGPNFDEIVPLLEMMGTMQKMERIR